MKKMPRLKASMTIFTVICMFFLLANVSFGSDAKADVRIHRLYVEESINKDGKAIVDIHAIIVNRGQMDIQNCTVALSVDGKEVVDLDYKTIERGEEYLFSWQHLMEDLDNKKKVTVDVAACPDHEDEKSSSNNSKSKSVNIEPSTYIDNDDDVDLKLLSFKALSGRNDENELKYWQQFRYQNRYKGSAETFSIRYIVNGLKEGIIQVPPLPGKSQGVYSNFYLEIPFIEGKNLVKIMVDSENEVKEKSEANTYYYLVDIYDGMITGSTKLSKSKDLLIQGLMYVDQRLLSEEVLAEMNAVGGVLGIPILNAGETLDGKTIVATADVTTAEGAETAETAAEEVTADDSTDDKSHELKIELKQGRVVYEQNYEIDEWKKGVQQTFYFTNKIFKKLELVRSFKVTVYIDGKKLYSRNHKASCF